MIELSAEDLTCVRAGREVFHKVCFALQAGQMLAVTGANGAGKSSLLRLVAGLIHPAQGRVVIRGGDPELCIAEQAHYVGHQDAIKPGLTPRETLVFWAALRGQEVRPDAPLLAATLAAFALEPVADWPCRWLSAGQRRRLALTRLLVIPAPLWLLDEPFSALDDDNRARLEEAIAGHRASGGRVALATHIPAEIDAAAEIRLDALAPQHGDVGEE